jgi:hypothetical protein
MRFVVLLFGFFAAVLTALAGVFLCMFNQAMIWVNEQDWLKGLLEIANPNTLLSLDSNPGVTALFLWIAAGFGLLGTILGFRRCGWQGALLMLVPVAGPALMNPWTLVFTGFQLFVAFLSFFVRPLPIVPQED